MTKQKLAIFDWNGTLFDDAAANLSASNASLHVFNAPSISMEQYRDTFDFPVIHFYERNGVSMDDYLRMPDEANHAFIDHYERRAKKCSLRDGAEDLLVRLKAEGYHCMVLSNHEQLLLRAQVRRQKIHQYFEYISGNRDTGTIVTAMNKEQRLRDYLIDNNYDPEQAFIIGDSFEEPHIARDIGLKSINITGGAISRERLIKANADAIIDHFDELKEILPNLMEN